MIHYSNGASPLRKYLAILSALIATLLLVSSASAVDLDFNVANGNYTVASNWVDATTGAVSASPPTIDDRTFVRNNGTLLINSDVENLQMRIGYERELTTPDYDGNGFVDAADYVLWRKGGPLLNDSTPDSVGPEDYTLWRTFFGAAGGLQNLGMPGTLNWTAGDITGQGPIDGDPYSGGPDIRVGRLDTTNSVQYEFTGTAVQNGPTTKLLLPYTQSQLTIGDGVGSTHTPTSSYTFMDGTIGLAIGSNALGTEGTNGNSGILVRNGTFTMTGGQIIDVTPSDYSLIGLSAQRFLSVATATGAGVDSETVATANLSGGNINVLGGIRVATANHTRGYLNINGPVTIVTGGDTSIGYQPNTNGVNAVGEMNMSDGSFQVGRTDINPNTGAPYSLSGRFQIGDRGKGILNMSGGIITVTRNVRVANQPAAGGSIINLTGGTITTPNLEMRVVAVTGTDDGASIILDGPTASFVQTTTAGSTGATIGNNGMALFEVRQGTALLGGGGSTIQVGNSALSAATINVKGGKLTLGGPLTRTNTPAVAPAVGLTGGILEFNNTTTTAAHSFQADLTNAGTELITKANEQLQVNVGSLSPSIPANFAMTSGSWDIDIKSHNVVGADWFNVPNGTASLTGGTLNINYLAGFTPNIDEVFTIIKGSAGVTLNGAGVTIAGSGAGSWTLQTAGTTDIQLKFVGPGAGAGVGLDAASAAIPEPSSLALLMFAVAGLLTAKRTRYGISV